MKASFCTAKCDSVTVCAVKATKNSAHKLARIFYYGLLTWYT